MKLKNKIEAERIFIVHIYVCAYIYMYIIVIDVKFNKKIV